MAVPMEFSSCFWLCLLVAAFHGPCVAIRVSTAGNLLVQNGTDVSLSCSFSSAGTIGPSFSINWTFKPQNGGISENLLHYAGGKAYPTKKGRFSGRISFEGNVMRGDASLKLRNVEFTDNGTYTCSVINPPNIDGNVGEVKLGVVLKVKWSEGTIVMVVVACLAGFVIVLVMITAIVMVCKKRNNKRDERSGLDEIRWSYPINEQEAEGGPEGPLLGESPKVGPTLLQPDDQNTTCNVDNEKDSLKEQPTTNSNTLNGDPSAALNA